MFYTRDTKSSRALLPTAIILSIISIALVALWSVIYFMLLYKDEYFYQGHGDTESNEYSKNNKKVYIFELLAESIVLLGLYTYWLCVVGKYRTVMHGPKN